ncbi:hypothetical protein HPB50_013281 [Hyalomma asiaticum]|uniref:Uncharacterized protein n=1 Tax=Hyalomma asiaticum TaxID=266040 RepID=A0ACB7T1T9_HYAAI|nr:hypothetical protein HPB50_013281 [Hyalomma asiaticum]
MGARSRAQTRAILAFALKGAFDNVAHDLILKNLAESHCGDRIYNYTYPHRRDRTATMMTNRLTISQDTLITMPLDGAPTAILQDARRRLNRAEPPNRTAARRFRLLTCCKHSWTVHVNPLVKLS